MSDFTLDTSGAIDVPLSAHYLEVTRWRNLTLFTQGALTKALEELQARLDSEGLTNPNFPVRFCDLAPETLARFIEDCRLADRDQSSFEYGALWWQDRQNNSDPHFRPCTLYVADDGKVRHREGA